MPNVNALLEYFFVQYWSFQQYLAWQPKQSNYCYSIRTDVCQALGGQIITLWYSSLTCMYMYVRHPHTGSWVHTILFGVSTRTFVANLAKWNLAAPFNEPFLVGDWPPYGSLPLLPAGEFSIYFCWLSSRIIIM